MRDGLKKRNKNSDSGGEMMIWSKVVRKLYHMVLKEVQKANCETYHNLYQCTGEDNVLIRGEGAIQNKPSWKDHIKIGSHVLIDGIIQCHTEEGNLTIGDWSYIGPNSRVWAFKEISIGNHVLISHNCNIFDSNCHPLDAKDRQADYRHILCGGGILLIV